VSGSQAAASFVIGTAGHIDHGKSALVKALTGIDPDRLEEEKRRGMTIDLGFAYLDLPSGRRAGIVDVPGHQRFLKNMLAGVHGIDAVLFVVAADEGPMPQTREHLAIIDLLDIRHGVVALTKSDLVDQEWLQLVTQDVAGLIEGSVLRGAPLVPVSSLTGSGLDQLSSALDQVLASTSPRPDSGRPRLPVDRSFAIAGFGTVVTGTLIGGAIRVGDELSVLPGGRRVRVRGLQQHNQSVEEARPGSRTAVNLAGTDRSQVSRGDVLAPAGSLVPSRRIDAHLSVLPDVSQPVKHRAQALLYHETAEVMVELLLLERDELTPGSGGWVQIYSSRPLAARAGDRFILRRPAPPETLAGGVFVDTAARRHRRGDPELIQALTLRQRGDPAEAVLQEVSSHTFGLSDAELSQRLGMLLDSIEPAAASLVASGSALRLGPALVSAEAWRRLSQRALTTLDVHHTAHPLRWGMPREELKSRTGIPLETFNHALARWLGDGLVIERGGELALVGREPKLSSQQRAVADALVAELASAPYSPPPLSELIERHHLTPSLIAYLVAEGTIVRVNEDTAFSASGYQQAVSLLRSYLEEHGKITVAQARDLLGSSRRYVLPLLEWLDSQKITRRVGDDRILRT
jgi:selenocysteine-specific elongation factor